MQQFNLVIYVPGRFPYQFQLLVFELYIGITIFSMLFSLVHKLQHLVAEVYASYTLLSHF